MPASVRDVLLLIRTKEDAQRALSGISREMRRADAIAQVANLRARARQLRTQAEQMKLAGATKQQITSTLNAARAFDDQARAVGLAAKRTEIMNRIAQDAGVHLAAMGTAAIVAGAGIAYGLKQAIDVAAEYDRQTRLTFTQVDKRFKPSLIELGAIGRRVAREIAIPFEQIQPALFEVFSSTEANVKEAEALLKSFAKAAVAGQTDVQTASRATIGIMNAFSIPFSKVNRILDIQFQLVQEGIGTYEEWSQRIGLVTPSAVRANQSIETMAAALATATRMGISAARSGTAVARAFDAISNPKTVRNLERMGIKVRDARGELLPLVDILGQWRKALLKLPPAKRVEALLETIKGAGSTIEARRFLQNMLLTTGGLELFQDVLGEMEGDLGAFDRAYGEMAGSVSAQSTIVRNQWQLMKEAIGRALMPAFQDLLTQMQKVLDWFNKLPASTQKNIAMALLFASAIGILGGALAIVLGGLISFGMALSIVGIAGLKIIAIIGLVVLALAGIGIAIKVAYDNSKPFRDLVQSLWQRVLELRDIAVQFARDVAAEFKQNLLPALKDLWKTIEEEVLPKLKKFTDWAGENLIPKIKEAARWIRDVLGVAFQVVATIIRESVIPTIKSVMDEWDKHKEQLLPLIRILGDVAKILLIVAAVIVGSFIVAIAGAIAITMYFAGGALKIAMAAISAFVSWIKTVIGWIKRFIEWFRSLDDDARKALRSLVSATTGAKNAIVGAFRNAGSWLVGAGRAIVQGLINGIGFRRGDLMAAARNIGRSAMNAAMAALEVRSPSRVFMRIGNQTVLGFIKGIVDTQPELTRTVYGMAKMAAATASHTEPTFFANATRSRVGVGVTSQPAFVPTNPTPPRGKLFDVNIYTQEINPQRNAAELGWELEGRLRS